MDCIDFMKSKPDNHFDLAIVDPPYGIGERMYNGGARNKSTVKFTREIKNNNWDKLPPSKEYFKELQRVSKNQIVWGGNYFGLPKNRCFICWEKMVYAPTMSQVEYAWTSFDSPARLIKINNNNNKRIHPTQKPIKLYRWILQNYAKEGFRILDTHGGSFTNSIACDMEGYDLCIIEINKVYFDKGIKEYNKYKSQLNIFK